MKTFITSLLCLVCGKLAFSQDMCPSYFNTASTVSVCGWPGELKMAYLNGCPAVAPYIDSVYSNGVKAPITLAAPDTTPCKTYKQIRYCLTSGVIPSGHTYVVYFRNPDNSTFVCTLSCTCVALPLKFTSFTASVTGNNVVCNWTTENEFDNNGFQLERSEDGRNFSTVGKEVSNPAGKYQWIDKDAAASGKNHFFYRVKQVDGDGKFSYSNISSVKLNSNSGVTVVPNPFRESVSVSFKAGTAGTADIKIINLAGQLAIAKQFIAVKGNNNMLLNGIGGLQRGIYMMQIAVNGVIIENQKLVKQ